MALATWPTMSSCGRKLGWCRLAVPPLPTNIISVGALRT